MRPSRHIGKKQGSETYGKSTPNACKTNRFLLDELGVECDDPLAAKAKKVRVGSGY
jgi:hypothetical protein